MSIPSCKDYPLECEVGTYDLSRHLNMQDVNNFFKNGIKCNTSIVYISKHDPVHISEALIKHIDEECNYIFREKRGWYFIYTNLFKNMLLWSAHPRMYGKEGFVGNHLSIGEKDGHLTIHHTTYLSKEHHIGQYVIIWDKTHEWYTSHPDGSLNSSNVAAIGLWNDIARSTSTSITGGGKPSSRPHLIRPSKKAPKLSFQHVIQRLTKIQTYLKEPDKYMVSIRVPYMTYKKQDLKVFNKYADSTTLIINHDSKTAFALMNFE